MKTPGIFTDIYVRSYTLNFKVPMVTENIPVPICIHSGLMILIHSKKLPAVIWIEWTSALRRWVFFITQCFLKILKNPEQPERIQLVFLHAEHDLRPETR